MNENDLDMRFNLLEEAVKDISKQVRADVKEFSESQTKKYEQLETLLVKIIEQNENIRSNQWQ